jgi:hypothetical protein
LHGFSQPTAKNYSGLEPQLAVLPNLLDRSRKPPGIFRKSGCSSKDDYLASASQAKGAISMLQEFVQCSQTFHIPSNHSVLQWSFESQMADSATLEFRAIVAFFLEGVPHHVAGTWHQKKKEAQRDAAERALGLFVGRWGEQLLRVGRMSSDQHVGVKDTLHAAPPAKSSNTPGIRCLSTEESLVEECCRSFDMCCGPPRWSVCWGNKVCTATLEIALFDVQHIFAGNAEQSEDAARKDVARRVLWYLQCPGFQDAFEPDPTSQAIATMKIPPPPADWARDPATEVALEVAERKTAIMRVQNRLQRQFSRQLKPGVSVWEWSYEMDANDEEWPPLYRASVTIPVMNTAYKGDWARGQRDAQLDAIQQVVRALDEFEAQM